MKSTGPARRLAAVGAGVAVLATMVTGSVAAPVAASAAPSKPTVSATTPKASPKHHEGACPVTVTFSAKVKVKVAGKTTVAYRWLRGDGSKSKTKTRTLKGKGLKTITVTEKATFTKDVKGWQALQVLSPRKVTTKKGRFAVSCEGPTKLNVVKKPKYAKAYVDVDDYAGLCTPSTKVTAKGLIKTSHPTWVKYRWIHNGKVVDHGKTKVGKAGKVFYTFPPRHSHKGWVALDIVYPRYGGSDRDHYKVWCKKPAPPQKPAKAWASVTGADDYTDVCPVDRTFNGTVSVNRGGTVVKYRWAGPGYKGAVQTLAFGKYGPKSKNVSHTVNVGEDGTVKRWIEILGPNHAVSNVARAKVECRQPVTAKVTSMSAVPNYSTCDSAAGIGPAIRLSATVTTSGPTTLTYQWDINDGQIVVREVTQVPDTWVNVTHDLPGSALTLGKVNVKLTLISPPDEAWTAVFEFPCPTV